MEINRLDNLGFDRQRMAQNNQQVPPTEEELQAGQGQQAIAPPPAAGESAEAGQAASQGSQMEGASSASATQSAIEMADTDSDSDDDSAYQAAVNKVNSGQSLTASELDLIRSKNPSLYSKAIRAQNARSEVRSQLEEDPSHALQSARNVMSQIMAEIDASDEGNTVVLRAMRDESALIANQYDQVDFTLDVQQASTFVRLMNEE